jgi:hypothetical protein
MGYYEDEIMLCAAERRKGWLLFSVVDLFASRVKCML